MWAVGFLEDLGWRTCLSQMSRHSGRYGFTLFIDPWFCKRCMLAWIAVHACTSKCRQLLCPTVHIHILGQECECVQSATNCILWPLFARNWWQSCLQFDQLSAFCSMAHIACSYVLTNLVKTGQICTMQSTQHLVHGKPSLCHASVSMFYSTYVYCTISYHIIH